VELVVSDGGRTAAVGGTLSLLLLGGLLDGLLGSGFLGGFLLSGHGSLLGYTGWMETPLLRDVILDQDGVVSRERRWGWVGSARAGLSGQLRQVRVVKREARLRAAGRRAIRTAALLLLLGGLLDGLLGSGFLGGFLLGGHGTSVRGVRSTRKRYA
jgi:hypothetical protein